eukprot:TRINITY_DN3321_c0_g1_i1.p1 TRINITY_DN3321_c0_g1~~TRINITY_DN3321_c0_g1_i1.p1  ORF type:complete len:308 (+),score=63.12 TRINITY_DN3321_c0_g1_i1:102-1025(+)
MALSEKELSQVKHIVENALREDLQTGDVTTLSCIPEDLAGKADFVAKADGIIAGLQVVELVFKQLSPSMTVTWDIRDGDFVRKGTYFGTVRGPVRCILMGERLALNLLQRMSGVATATHKLTSLIPPELRQTCKILDTRKTAPGLRVLDKFAVRMGGGVNHRFGLFDMAMIKNNHIDACGSVRAAVERVQSYLRQRGLEQKIQIEVEARTLEEVQEILNLSGVFRIMLDNMVKVEPNGTVNTELLQQAVQLINRRAETEASGNIDARTVAAIAKTGVDFMSVGYLTHSAQALDISLRIKQNQPISRL